MDEITALLTGVLADPETVWTLGTFGALAEFRRGAGEPAQRLDVARIGLVTPRGAIALDPTSGLVPVAYETPLDGGWSQAVALCLPEAACALSRRGALTELGPDREALRAEDRAAALFDLGLGLLQVDVCLRSADPESLAWLRGRCGRPLRDPAAVLRLAADRVFLTRGGRIEVFGDHRDGPRAFVVPHILARGRTHAATAPIPPGLVPVAEFAPPHPCRDAQRRAIPFDPGRHAAFQALYARWGDPRHVALKASILAGGKMPGTGLDRHARAVAKVAMRQAGLLPPARESRARPASMTPRADKTSGDTER